MPFGLMTRVGPEIYHVSDGGPDPQGEGVMFGETYRPIVRYWDTLRCAVQKQLNRRLPIAMPF